MGFKTILFIIFVENLPHCMKEIKNYTLKNSKLQFRDP